MQEPQLAGKTAFRVIGLKYRGKNENNEIPQLWVEFMRHRDKIVGLSKPITAYGICDNLDIESGQFDYIAGLGVDSIDEIPDGLVGVDIPAQEYAVFACTLPTIADTYKRIYETWLPQSSYKRAAGPEFELYDMDFDPQKADSKLYLHVPVEKK